MQAVSFVGYSHTNGDDRVWIGRGDPGRSGEKRERLDMRGPHDREVTAVKSRDVLFAEALGRRDDRRVDSAERKIGISLDEFRHFARGLKGSAAQAVNSPRAAARSNVASAPIPSAFRTR
jgi:hypothetical protein